MKKKAFWSIVAGIFLLDQLSKLIIIQRIPLHDSVHIFPFFSLTHIKNTGAAFGILQDSNIFFIVTSIGILGILAAVHKSFAQHGKWALWALILLWGGALGNLADRLFLGSVTDFLDFHWKDWHWFTFNIADSAITISLIFLFVQSFQKKNQDLSDSHSKNSKENAL